VERAIHLALVLTHSTLPARPLTAALTTESPSFVIVNVEFANLS